MTYARPTEPLSVLGVLTDGLLLYRASIRPPLYVPLFLLLLIVGQVSLAVEMYYAAGAGSSLLQVAFYVATFYLYGFIIASVHFVASSGPSDIRSSLTIAMHRLPAILAVYLLIGLAVFVGYTPWMVLLDPRGIVTMTLALFVVVLLVATTLFASLILTVTEGLGPIEALRGSYSLVRRHWAKTSVVLAIIIALVTGMSIAVDKVTLALSDPFDSNLVANTVSGLTWAAFQAIVMPFGVCLIYAAYQDLRLRQNGMASG